jgi:dynein heavy chain
LFGQGNLLIFGDLLKLESTKAYEEIKDINKLKTILLEYLDDYNITATSKMNLVFFEDAIAHISRVARVLRQPRGNMMLIGVGGSGKQSLTKLSCHMLGYTPRQVEITKNFGTEQFREFIKELMFSSGIDGTNLCLVLTDTQIVKESFLEDINNILNTGDVPNLFLPEDYDKIVNSVRPILVEMKRIDTV